MNNERIKLSMKEERLNKIFIKFKTKETTNKQVFKLSHLSERQYYRKKKDYMNSGIMSLSHKNIYYAINRGC